MGEFNSASEFRLREMNRAELVFILLLRARETQSFDRLTVEPMSPPYGSSLRPGSPVRMIVHDLCFLERVTVTNAELGNPR